MKKFTLISLLFIQSAFASTLMVSHKGAWKDHLYPQNTLIALERAVEHGFEGIEFDVFRSADGEFVLGHDDDITKVSTCKGKISQMTIAEIKECKVTKNTTLPITQILVKKVKEPQAYTTLNEVVDKLFFDERVKFIWIDMKEQSTEVIPALQALVDKIGDKKILDKIIINNASADILARLKVELPEFKYSLEGKWGSEPLTDYSKYLDGVGTTHDMVSLNVGIYVGHEPLYKLICRGKRFWDYLDKFLTEADSRGITAIGWTVNRVKKIQRLKEMGIPYLLTDKMYPNKL